MKHLIAGYYFAIHDHASIPPQDEGDTSVRRGLQAIRAVWTNL